MAVHRADDGVQIVYDDVAPATPDAAARPVVLHHGFAADTHVNWDRPGITDALVAAGRRVIALDARGHGRSDKPHDAAAYGEARMATDVVALVDELGLDRYDLVGYSMGAIVAARVAARGTSRVRRLVLGGIGAGVVPGPHADARFARLDAVAAALEADDRRSITDPSGAAFRAFADATKADRAALAAVIRATERTPLPFAEIHVPTLVLVGDADAIARAPELLAGAIAGATVRVVSGDHLGAVTKPEFRAALLEFLT